MVLTSAEATEAMAAIEASSGKISNIILCIFIHFLVCYHIRIQFLHPVYILLLEQGIPAESMQCVII